MIQATCLHAVAILGPNASARELRAFESPASQFTTWTSSDDLKAAVAVLVFGGDGTIHRHLPELSTAGIPVLMVPHGSGNDFARALGIVERSQSLAAWKEFCAGESNLRRVDLGVVRSEHGEKPFCCVASAGLDAEANRRANSFPRWLRARGGYFLAGLISMLSFRPHCFQLRAAVHGSVTQSVAVLEAGFLAACANTAAYGDGLRIAPQARLDDGLLDICFVRAMPKARLLVVAFKVISGSHVRLPEVQYFKTSWLRLEPDPPLALFADGEYVCQTPVEISVRERGLRVIVPRSSPQVATAFSNPLQS